jgi:AraC-like DNA-binding protein
MTTPPGVADATFQFSTDVFPERERVSAWLEIFGRGMAKVDVTPIRDLPFFARMSMRVMPDLVIVSGAGTVKSVGRSRSLIADGNDSFVLQIASCAGSVSRLRHDIPVAAGDAIALPNSHVGTFTFEGEQSVWGVNAPRALLKSALRDPDAVFTRPVSKDNEALRLLRTYVAGLERLPPLTNEEVQRAVVAHVHDLVALAFGATRDAAEIARTRGVRAARLQAAKAFVTSHLGRSELSAVMVATHLGVTPRYVHMLFESEGMSFTEFVLLKRLERVHRMLGAIRHAGDTISMMAYAVGFADLSHFNRSFRRHYGCTPSDVRAGAARDRGD